MAAAPPPPPEPFNLWKFLWTKRRGFLYFHAVVATVLILVLVLHFLFGDAATAHYRYLASVLLLFQATAFGLDLLWSVKDQKDRARRRREAALEPQDKEDDWW